MGRDPSHAPGAPGGEIVFAFCWTEAGRWEGKDFRVAVAGGH